LLTPTSGDRPKTSVLTKVRVIQKLKKKSKQKSCYPSASLYKTKDFWPGRKICRRNPRVCVMRVRVNEVLL